MLPGKEPYSMRFLSLFSGIGGFDIGLEAAGMTCVGQVEIDPFCRHILAHHWPHVKRMEDIYNVNGNEFGHIDLICGGVPCQPASSAGKRRGKLDDRWLWPEAFRLVRNIRPTWLLFENVRGITSLESGVVFDDLLSELESYGAEQEGSGGYEVAPPLIIPACAVDAPHRRDRVWIVAHRIESGLEGHSGNGSDSIRQVRGISQSDRSAPEDGVCGGTGIMAHSSGERSGKAGRFRCDESEKRSARRGEDVPYPIGEHDDRSRYGAGQVCGKRSETADVSAGETLAHSNSRRSAVGPALLQSNDIINGCGRATSDSPLIRQREGLPDSRGSGEGTATPIERGESSGRCRWLPESGICRVANGVPNRVHRLRALGNAVVPPLVEKIGRAIMLAHLQHRGTL